MSENKKTLPIKSLEIRIDSDSSVPHIVLNGIDFQAEKIGLKGLKIVCFRAVLFRMVPKQD